MRRFYCLLSILMILATVLPLVACGDLGNQTGNTYGSGYSYYKVVPTAITANTTASTQYNYYICNASANNITLTLPKPVMAWQNIFWVVTKTDNSTNQVFLNANIGGLTNVSLTSQSQSIVVASNGTAYYTLVSSYFPSSVNYSIAFNISW
jgi:hypothetical protein